MALNAYELRTTTDAVNFAYVIIGTFWRSSKVVTFLELATFTFAIVDD